MKILTQIVLQLIIDREKREKAFIGLITSITAFMVIISLPVYLLTHPIETFAMMFGDESPNIKIVENFQNENGYYGDGAVIDISGEYIENDIPLFIQWDKRWGLYAYGSGGTIASSGCGPTSIAMIAVGLTGDTSVNPKVVCDYSASKGYRVAAGTSWGLMTTGAEHFGLKGTQIGINTAEISESLRNGKPIIASMKKGHFTQTGHFIVLKGITSDGKIIINDPNNYKLSEKLWDISIIINESKGMWNYEKLYI